jgi:hypothetical protein
MVCGKDKRTATRPAFGDVAHLFDESNLAVRRLIAQAIRAAYRFRRSYRQRI